MVPYLEQPALVIGGMRLHLFGALVALGVAAGLVFTYRRADEAGIPRREMAILAWSALILGFFASAAFEVVFYKPEELDQGLGRLLDPSQGMSSYGGFIGALAGVVLARVLIRRSVVPHADCMVQGLVLGWVFGRLGCTFAHDHPGRPSDFLLAVRYPGGARHDLGFYEFLFTLIVLLPAILFAHRKGPHPPGTYVAIVSLLYAPARFLLDFLRATDHPDADPRYLGLTFAQYASLALLGVGAYFLVRVRRG